MTFKDLYEAEKAKSEALSRFIDEVANVTKKHRITVMRWVREDNPITPDELTQTVLANHFGKTPEELFPTKN